jgi:cyclophilin family peptidyl-prolyl cis-trans isomerase
MTGRITVRGIPCHGTNLVTRLAVLFLLTIGGCGNETDSTVTPGSAADPAAAGNSASAAKQVDHKHPVIRIETNQGAITVRLDAVKSPGTVRNFLNYAGEGFYDNTLVHYVDPGKMILAGGYAADGQPKPTRPPIRNEAHNGLKNVRGTIAMARDQAMIDNSTSQFFINLADAPQRDHQGIAPEQYGYCVFGEVTDGLDVAQRISELATADQGGDLRQVPQPPVVISSIRVVM